MTRSNLLALVLLAWLAAAMAPARAAPDEIVVELSGGALGRSTVAVGGTVSFHSVTGAHEISGDDSSWWTGEILEGATASLRFEAVGEFPFHCRRHPDETGTIVVEPREPPPPPSNVAPVVRFLEPGDGASVAGMIPIRLNAEDPDTGPGSLLVRVRLDGRAWMTPLASSATEWRFDWNAEAAGGGDHVWEAIAFDGAAESPIAAIRLVVSAPPPPPQNPNEPPSLAITRPEAGASLHPTEVLVTGAITDADSPESALRVEVSVDGGAWERARGSVEWVFVWDARGAAPGPHVIAARATDGIATSPVEIVRVLVKGTDGFTPTTPSPPPPQSQAASWRDAALDFGWVAIALVALSGAWAWASSRPGP